MSNGPYAGVPCGSACSPSCSSRQRPRLAAGVVDGHPAAKRSEGRCREARLMPEGEERSPPAVQKLPSAVPP